MYFNDIGNKEVLFISSKLNKVVVMICFLITKGIAFI